MEGVHGPGSEQKLHTIDRNFDEDFNEVLPPLDGGYMSKQANKRAEKKHEKANIHQ